ncbi:MAG: hypothetical protein JST09_07755 [Bacteroidetes bacterium]|nr:hypothetical protein [Bacteroidota bacterium]
MNAYPHPFFVFLYTEVFTGQPAGKTIGRVVVQISWYLKRVVCMSSCFYYIGKLLRSMSQWYEKGSSDVKDVTGSNARNINGCYAF